MDFDFAILHPSSENFDHLLRTLTLMVDSLGLPWHAMAGQALPSPPSATEHSAAPFAARRLVQIASMAADFLMVRMYDKDRCQAYYRCKVVETKDYSEMHLGREEKMFCFFVVGQMGRGRNGVRSELEAPVCSVVVCFVLLDTKDQQIVLFRCFESHWPTDL